MKLPIISRSRHEREIEAAREVTRREQKDRVAESARYLLNLAAAGATNIRLTGRNRELAERLELARAEADDARRVTAFLGEQLLSAVGEAYTPMERAAVGLPVRPGSEVKTP